MVEPIPVTPSLTLPSAALSWEAVRASGPGGQNVNKVASKVELHLDLALSGIPEEAIARLRGLARFDAEGRVLVVSQRTRDQSRNLDDAREKLAARVRRALARPRPRRPPRPTRSSQLRRLESKRRQGDRKRDRQGGAD